MLSIPPSDSLSLSLNSQSNQSKVKSQQVRKFLRFYLGSGDRPSASTSNSDLALLEAEIVTEVITISPKEILPVPQMPYCVLGIYSWRSEMLWIVDVENLMGYPPSLNENTHEDATILVMVVQVQGQSMGLVVSRIDNIIEQNLDNFKSSSSEIFSEDIMPFLYGYFTDENNNIIMLIDAEEIFHFFSINPSFSNYK
jgi:positive phototaxis protein PixI